MCYKSPCPRGSSAAALEKHLLLSMRHWQLLWQHLGAPRHSSAQKGEHLGHTGAAGSWAGSPRAPCDHTVTSGQQPTAGWLSRSAHGSTAQVPGCRGTLGTGKSSSQGHRRHWNLCAPTLAQHTQGRFPTSAPAQVRAWSRFHILSALNPFELFSFSLYVLKH